jgi:hypothetical protein
MDDSIPKLADALAHAIALAEGGLTEGTLPCRIHNPGDLELGDRGFGIHTGKTIYQKADPEAAIDDRTDGWSALRRECMAILSGASLIYRVTDSFEILAAKYTGGDAPGAWCRIVTGKLGIEPETTLIEWVKASQS